MDVALGVGHLGYSSLEGYRVIRRDVFYDYFKHMMQTDAHLPTPSKHVGLKGLRMSTTGSLLRPCIFLVTGRKFVNKR